MNCGSFFRLLLITITALSLTASCAKKVPPPPPPTVIVAPVVEKLIFPTIDFIGLAIAREDIFLRARVSGFLVKKNFENGSYVKKGDIIFVIEKDQYKTDVEAAKGDLLQAQADYNNAKIEYDRQHKLVTTHAISQKEYDKAVQILYSAEGALLKAKANLETAKLNLSYTDIFAPYDGKIGAAEYNVGNLVGPTSKPLVELTMLDPIEIQFAVSEALLISALQKNGKNSAESTNINDALKAQKIVPRLILSNGTEYPHPGDIYFVDNRINNLTGTINLRALFPNPNHLILPGAYVRIKLSQSNPTTSLLIPQKSVQESQSGKFVYVVNKEKKVEVHNVTILDAYDTDYIVSKGVKAGDVIVIEGLQKARPGITVNPLTENEMKKQYQAQPKE